MPMPVKQISTTRHIGFWREEFPDVAGMPRFLKEPKFDWESSELVGLRSYLEKGTILVASPGVRRSIIEAREIAGSTSIRTDGLWIWPDTLPYYLRKARPALPTDFRERARSYNYVPPAVDAATLATLKVPV